MTLIAATTLRPEAIGAWVGIPEGEWAADALAEFAGRACYQSWDRPNPKTAENKAYLNNIIQQRHFSVLEHASATFYVEGASRSLTHELVRHRHLSFSQVSQRYVDESNAAFIIPPALAGDDAVQHALKTHHAAALSKYEWIVNVLTGKGLSRKQAREAARSILPNGTETKIVVTGNIRAWREFIDKRNSPAADAEIRLLAEQVLRHLKWIAPNSVQDYT